MQINKTDKNDAYGLAQIVKAGWYRAGRGEEPRQPRAAFDARHALPTCRMRVNVSNQIGARCTASSLNSRLKLRRPIRHLQSHHDT